MFRTVYRITYRDEFGNIGFTPDYTVICHNVNTLLLTDSELIIGGKNSFKKINPHLQVVSISVASNEQV